MLNPSSNNAGNNGGGYYAYAPARQDQPSTSYGGTNYLYQNPAGVNQTNTRASANQPARSNFQAFTGEGYSLN